MTSNSTHLSCVRCILTKTDDKQMEFDANGLCNHCRQFDSVWTTMPKTNEESRKLIEPLMERIKARGRNDPYDCLIGLSGGVDSSYIALLTKRYGLRPLAVHFDNGWNSELAVDNIERVVSKLGIDLVTHVIDWGDFRALQLAYLKASVIDIEVLTDHAIYGAIFNLAMGRGIKTVISGVNHATESVLPYSWIYEKLDGANIRDVFRQFGDGRKLSNYPFVDSAKMKRINAAGIEVVRLLDFVVYNDAQARRAIADELDWRSYGGKHHESIFTRFYQCYFLPKKFGVDKRKAHLSNLICSGQITREQALFEIQQDHYPANQAEEDLEYVLKKLGLSREEFDLIMTTPQRQHKDFITAPSLFARYPFLAPLRPLWQQHKGRIRKLLALGGGRNTVQ